MVIRQGKAAELRRAVFFDRDGTLNRAFVRDGVSVPPSSLDQFELLPGVGPALAELRRAGFCLVVATNQPDVARGTRSRDDVEQMNALLRRQIELDAVLCCYHDDRDGCDCRKPAPGMCLAAAERLGIDLSRSFFVGDSWRDMEAGRRAGCTTILVGVQSSEFRQVHADFVARDVAEAASLILSRVREAARATIRG